MRPTIHQTYVRIAEVMAERATCPRASVGSVVTSYDRRLLSVGYNGAPRDVAHCEDAGCILDKAGHCVRAVHAEMNALLNLEGRADGGTMYCTHAPCPRCAAAIAQAGIVTVVYWHDYGPPDEQRYVEALYRTLGIGLMRLED